MDDGIDWLSCLNHDHHFARFLQGFGEISKEEKQNVRMKILMQTMKKRTTKHRLYGIQKSMLSRLENKWEESFCILQNNKKWLNKTQFLNLS